MKLAIVPTTANPESGEQMMIDNNMIFDDEQNAIQTFCELIMNSNFDWNICVLDQNVYKAAAKYSMCTIKQTKSASQMLAGENLRANIHLVK